MIKMMQYNRIMAAGIKQFAEFGYDNTSVEMIVESINMSKANFYNYFVGKEELYNKIVDYTAGFYVLKIKHALILNGNDAVDSLDIFIDTFCLLSLNNRLGFKILMQEFENNAIYNEKVSQEMKKLYEMFNEYIGLKQMASSNDIYLSVTLFSQFMGILSIIVMFENAYKNFSKELIISRFKNIVKRYK